MGELTYEELQELVLHYAVYLGWTFGRRLDDILVAEYTNPRLTTVRQPLRKMGTTAAEILVKRIQNPDQPFSDTIWFTPELIVRESTASVPLLKTPHPKPSKRR